MAEVITPVGPIAPFDLTRMYVGLSAAASGVEAVMGVLNRGLLVTGTQNDDVVVGRGINGHGFGQAVGKGRILDRGVLHDGACELVEVNSLTRQRVYGCLNWVGTMTPGTFPVVVAR